MRGLLRYLMVIRLDRKGHCWIEAKSVHSVHQAGEADPSATPENPNKPDI